MSQTWGIEIPTPLVQVVATEYWKSVQAGAGMWTGYNEFNVQILVGDVVLVERAGNDNDLEDNQNMTLDELREQTVREFGERLKEVLGL